MTDPVIRTQRDGSIWPRADLSEFVQIAVRHELDQQLRPEFNQFRDAVVEQVATRDGVTAFVRAYVREALEDVVGQINAEFAKRFEGNVLHQSFPVQVVVPSKPAAIERLVETDAEGRIQRMVDRPLVDES